MSIVNHHHRMGKLWMVSSAGQLANHPQNIITIDIDELLETDIKIALPHCNGNDGHYLQSGGKCGDYYRPIDCQIVDNSFDVKDGLTPISNDILTKQNKIFNNHQDIKSYNITREMVTFVRGVVEINNSIAILYCNAFNQLMLIKNKVEYLIANETNTTWSTILVGSTGNLMIGNVFKGNLYHHYYLKGKFYEVPIDMTNDNEKFIAHLTKDGYPCYIYTRYSAMDEVTISYSSDLNGEGNWTTNIIHTRPSINDGYFRSYSLLNTYDGRLYLAESCKEKYFAISSCTDITKDDWIKDLIYETGFENYQVFNDGHNFIVDHKIYQLDQGWLDINLKMNILDICHQSILTKDGYLSYLDDSYQIVKTIRIIDQITDQIIDGSILLLPNGDLMVLIINNAECITIHKIPSSILTSIPINHDVILL